ncbi:MAG: hypothetical protein LUQ22_08465, partial [Methanotrichaceae archaeon]|nr:hypothetical protein [Methanotrichaceae archaeon]
NEDRKELQTLVLNVSIPRISVFREAVATCERIHVFYSGAPGLDKDWIGMYRTGSSEVISRQYPSGKMDGNLTFSASEAGSYEFRLI